VPSERGREGRTWKGISGKGNGKGGQGGEKERDRKLRQRLREEIRKTQKERFGENQ
jgi:hypothetical protein